MQHPLSTAVAVAADAATATAAAAAAAAATIFRSCRLTIHPSHPFIKNHQDHQKSIQHNKNLAMLSKIFFWMVDGRENIGFRTKIRFMPFLGTLLAEFDDNTTKNTQFFMNYLMRWVTGPNSFI